MSLTTAPPATAARPSTWTQLRPLLLRLHFWGGLLVAPFLLVASLTGLAYVFSPQLSDLLYRGQLFAAEGPRDAPVPLADQVAAAVATQPGGPLSTITVPGDEDRTTAVVFDVPGLAEDVQRTVYVDPYTGAVRGSLDTWSGYPPLQTVLDGLHRHLLLGEPGRVYSETAASWLPVLVLGGLALWVGRRRARRRDLVVPPLGARPGRARLRGWHATTALWMAVGLAFLGVTGLTWSTYAGERFQAVVTSLDGRSPQLAAEPVAVRDAPVIGVDEAVARARAAGLADRLAVTPPAEPGAVWTVAENADTWPVQRDRVALDPYTGAVTERIAWADHPVLAKLTTIGVLAHMGLLWGLPNQLALAALALGLLSVLFWGYRMAWLRRPARGAVAPLAPRGAFRALSQPVGFAVVLVAVAAGWLMPLFGVTLVAFLVLELVLSRRGRSAGPVDPVVPGVARPRSAAP